MPVVFGIRMSISTTSGTASLAISTASAPSEAWPTSSMPSSSSRTISSPRRNRAWSSAMSTRMGSAFGWSVLAGGLPLPVIPAAPGAVVGRSVTAAPSAKLAVHSTVRVDDPLGPVVLWLELALVDLLHEADDAVVVPATAVDNAELPALAVVVGEEVVADQLHLEQRLIDGHRVGCVELLPDDERTFAFHLDRHQAGHGRLGFGLVLVAGEGVGVVLRQRGQRDYGLRPAPPVHPRLAAPG